MKITRMQAAVTAVSLNVLTATLHADSFGSGLNEFSIDLVEVGNPGNPDDTGTTGSYHSVFGGVPYIFRIGSYEVSEEMINNANAEGNLGITIDIRGPNKPATSVSWNEAARFVNWLNEQAGFTHAYKFAVQPGELGYDSNASIELWTTGDNGYDANNPFRNSNAFYFLPSEDEWYKAAYYSGSGATYYDYATQSDQPTQPTPVFGGTSSGTAVFQQFALTSPADFNDAGGLSHFGTMAQMGNVGEWVESGNDGINNEVDELRTQRGGRWNDTIGFIRSSWNGTTARPTDVNDKVGFRIAARTIDPAESVDITSFTVGPGLATITWITTPAGAAVDIYRSTDLTSWGSPIVAGLLSSSYADDAAPSPRVFYVVVPAGTPYPTSP